MITLDLIEESYYIKKQQKDTSPVSLPSRAICPWPTLLFHFKKHQAFQTLQPLMLLNEKRAREDSNPRLMVPETIALSS